MARLFVATVENSDTHQRLPGEELSIRINGDGTLEANQVLTERLISTDQEDQASFEWWEYPVYRPRRDLSATVEIECSRPSSRIKVEPLMSVTEDAR